MVPRLVDTIAPSVYDINFKSKEGMTALQIAIAQKGSYNIIETLLKAEADPNVKYSKQQSPKIDRGDTMLHTCSCQSKEEEEIGKNAASFWS